MVELPYPNPALDYPPACGASKTAENSIDGVPAASQRRGPEKPPSFATNFAITAAGILFTGMALLGSWVSNRIESGILQNSAQSAALFMESIFEPLVQDLASSNGELSEASIRAIAGVVENPARVHGINSIRVWRRDGSLAYPLTIGQAPPAPEVREALNGRVVVSRLPTLPNADATSGVISIFSPMHRLGTNDVIAVAEYLEPANDVQLALQNGSRPVWFVVGASAFAMLVLLSGIVFGGTRVIENQHRALDVRFREQVRLNFVNSKLQEELRQARFDCIDINEQVLRRVGADLHDGPAQLLALAMLRLDDIGRAPSGDKRAAELAADALATVKHATVEAMKEIRSISSGLIVADQQWKTPSDAIRFAVDAHERRTGDHVECSIGCLPSVAPNATLVCLFRCVQEGLNNAHRHAGGKGVAVRATCNGRSYIVEIADSGPGFDVAETLAPANRLGLAGIRHRVESVGAELQIASSPGQGTCLRVTLPNVSGGCHDV